MTPSVWVGRSLVAGRARGDVLASQSGLSFWGGIDPETGIVIDQRHPWHGVCVTGKVLVLPSGRGSCTGSAVFLELAARGRAPAAILFREAEAILPLGGLIAANLFDAAVPMLRLDANAFAAAQTATMADVDGAGAVAFDGATLPAVLASKATSPLPLTAQDQAMLSGAEGPARQWAMEIILAMADLMDADGLVDVSQAHLDCCIHTGPASVAIIERLASMGATVKVPTTLNAISIDRARWRALGFPEGPACEAERQVAGYLKIGARETFTCAPYLLASAPKAGEQVAWGESNAVAFANSVIGAWTEKYPDYLDLCVALTGRAPKAGCHRAVDRLARRVIEVDAPPAVDDVFFPLLGLVIGGLSPNTIPAVTGLEGLQPSRDDLKAFAAAFATLSAAPMFHLVGLTPEAPDLARCVAADADVSPLSVDAGTLAKAWRGVAGELGETIDIACVAIGNPHASAEELIRLAALCAGRRKAPGVSAMITTSRDARAKAQEAGAFETLEAFGFEVIVDTCWCMLTRPLVPAARGAIITNSGKYAHYGPGLVDGVVRLGSLAACVDAAVAGRHRRSEPSWLTPPDR